jgi:hypothetical protein
MLSMKETRMYLQRVSIPNNNRKKNPSGASKFDQGFDY